MKDFDLSQPINKYFYDLTRIPRGSGNEQGISEYLLAFAQKHHLVAQCDRWHNVFIESPASKGYEQAEPVIIQAHIDMITEKDPGVVFDFKTDPLVLQVNNGWLSATGTTLGADDGVGVAYILAVLADEKLAHPKLQCILTSQEETGMVGARKLKAKDIKACRMISLDGSGEFTTVASCAGGGTVDITVPLNYRKQKVNGYTLTIDGLAGGHSGIDIYNQRGNAGKITARVLKQLETLGVTVQLGSLTGGTKVNAIMRQIKVTFCTGKTSGKQLKKMVAQIRASIIQEWSESEPQLTISLTETELSKTLDHKASAQVINLLYLMPDGMLSHSIKIDELALTSINLGLIGVRGDKLKIGSRIRSAYDTAVLEVFEQLKTIAGYTGATAKLSDCYPGWVYDENSTMRKYLKQVVKEVTGKKLVVQATHGGIECGVFKGLQPKMDPVNFGPIAWDCHTTRERLDLVSFERTYQILCKLLALCH